MPSPALSVLLPNYNHADFLPRCLDAILEQSFTDFEVVFVDDASKDDSLAVIEDYARKDSRIRIYSNSENRGVVYTLNRSLELSHGEFVLGAAADDYVLPDYFEDAVEQLRANPQAGLCLGLTRGVSDDGRELYVAPGMWADEPGYLSPDDLTTRMTHCGVPGPAIWRKDLFLQAGGYNPDLRWHCDWLVLQVIALRHGVCFLPRVTNVVRMVQGAYSANQHKQKMQREVLQQLLRVLTSDANRDIIPHLKQCGVLRQFGPELIRSAVVMPDPPVGLWDLLRNHFFEHAGNLIHEPNPEIRCAAIRTLGTFGRDAIPFYWSLRAMRRDPDPMVRSAVALATTDIRRDARYRILRMRAKSMIGSAIRTIDRFLHPLHHDRMERIEALLTQLVIASQNTQSGVHTIFNTIDKYIHSPQGRRDEAASPNSAKIKKSRAA